MNLARISAGIALTACFGLFFLAVAAPARAQDPAGSEQATGAEGAAGEITVYLDRSQRPLLRLAQPAMNGIASLDASAAAAARELDETLRQDLRQSGVFVLQGPEELALAVLTGEEERDFEQLRALGNELLLETEILQEGDRLVLEGRLFELASRRSLLGKRYRGGYSSARRVAHTFADEIVEFFTGRKGVALTSIAFQTDRGSGAAREVEIYLMDYDGYNQRPVTAHKTLSMSPDWSPDGGSLAYVSYLSGAPGIYAVDLRSGSKSSLVIDGTMNISPAISPDGRTIAFTRTVGDGNTEIFTARRDGSGLRRLTNSGAIDANPAWSPTGRDIAFTSNRAGTPQIYVMGAEGTDLRRVTFVGDYNDGATWTPDGTRVAHSSRRDRRNFVLALTDVVTLESSTLLAGAGSHETPSFSPDGRKLVFSSTRAGRQRQIFVMDLATAAVRQLTSQGDNTAPSWSKYLN